MASIKDQTINSAKWVAIDKFSRYGVNFLLGILMARLLAPEDFGVIGMITVVINITSLFVDSGFSSALIQRQNRSEKDFSTVFFFNVLVATLAYVLIYFCAPFIASFFKIKILEKILRVQSISLLINSFATIQTTQLTIKLNFKVLAISSLSASILSGILGVVYAYFGGGIWALVSQTLLYSLFYLLIISSFCGWRPKEHFSIDSFKNLGSFGLKLLASSLLHNIYTQLTTILIGKFYTPKDLGFYNRGSEFANMPSTALVGVLDKITFPIMSRIQEDKERLVSVYRKYIKSTSLVICFFTACLTALAKPLILLVLGDKWFDSIIYLHIFALSSMFNHFSSINLNLLKVIGRSDLFLRLEVIKKTISIFMLLCAVPFGIIYICIMMFIYNQIAVIINTYYTGKLFNLGYLTQIRDFSKYCFAALISCAPAYLLTFINISYLLNIILGIAASITLYYLCLRNDVLFIDTVHTIRQKIGKNLG